MKNELYNEKELKALEAEIRAMGIPYSESEPDERYFANFRVHLMERIEAGEQKQNVFAAAWNWLTTSPLRGLSVGATLAGVIIAVLMIRPISEPTVAVVAPAVTPVETVTPPANNPMPVAKIEPAPVKEKKIVNIPAVKNTAIAATAHTTNIQDAANTAGDFASMDEELSADDTDAPIDYTKLSESELESVIAVAQEMN